MLHDLHNAVILELPGNKRNYVPGTWLVYPAEGVNKEQYVVFTELLDGFADLWVDVAFLKYLLTVQQIGLQLFRHPGV